MDDQGISWLMKMMQGGGMAAFAASVAGRLMWHVGEVRKGGRKFFSKELLWEIPIAIGMGLVGAGFAEYMQFSGNVETGLVAGLSYLGPRGIEALLDKWLKRK